MRVVLVGTTHPGNIGASARAMKAMGLAHLHLVSPSVFPSAVATARAAGADDILAAVIVHESLDQALEGCGIAFGTTARGRRIGWPTLSPREAAGEILRSARAGDTAVVFGGERSGLSNEELDRCQRSIWIPTVDRFRSLNLAQAVQILAYELHLAADPAAEPAPRHIELKGGDRPAAAEELNDLQAHILHVMEVAAYHDPERPKLLERRLRRLMNRADLLHSEVQILRGFLAAVEAGLGAVRKD
ncbi:MAG: RNA methyltransferase [Gammaproteobacteria bacterium]|nr:RNA methyltransferase [Gammaproteobacteria bacterium]